MTFDFRVVEVKFPAGDGPIRTQTQTVKFASHINRATAVIRGFDVRYTNGEHLFSHQFVDTQAESIDNNNKTVTVKVQLQISDKSGSDNPFQGQIDVVVVADVA